MTDTHYMLRALQLARLGEGQVAPNPMVGAVLVHQQRIIAEGYHSAYGGRHAEVHCLDRVADAERSLIPESTMYVTLEPCAHFGKTPPCALRLIEERVGRVVVGMADPFPAVNGQGIRLLQEAGIPVTVGVLQEACEALNRKFLVPIRQSRPFITLKWAEQQNGLIGAADAGNWPVSSALARRWVHHLRSTHMAILVGFNTALLDNPRLNLRYAPGRAPLRLVVDLKRELPPHLHLFQDGAATVVVQAHPALERDAAWSSGVSVLSVDATHWLPHMLRALHGMKVQSLLVEGGTRTLQQFIQQHVYDEIFCLISKHSTLGHGIAAPTVPPVKWRKAGDLDTDQVYHHVRKH